MFRVFFGLEIIVNIFYLVVKYVLMLILDLWFVFVLGEELFFVLFYKSLSIEEDGLFWWKCEYYVSCNEFVGSKESRWENMLYLCYIC